MRLGIFTHYHHGLAAHLHPDGKCPYGSNDISIINPYTGKKVNLGLPYIFNGMKYYSLNLVSKALTAHDGIGVEFELGTNSTSGMFYACSTGNSSLNEGLGECYYFAYPTQNNTSFKTKNGEVKLFYHNKQAAYDDVACYAYISLENVREYMIKDGYFTDLRDGGSGSWSFKVKEASVKIIMPKNGESYNIGNELTVQVEIEHVASTRLIVGNYFFGYTDGFIEYKYNLENKSTVVFSKFSLIT